MAETPRSRYLRNKMWDLMNYYSFEKKIVVKKFRAWAKRKEVDVTRREAYKIYDRVMKKLSCHVQFQQNVVQMYENMHRMEAMVVDKALRDEDIQDYLAFIEMKSRTLGMRNENNVVINQIQAQMNTQNNTGMESPDEIIAKITEGFAKFGPLVTGNKQIGTAGGGQSIPAIPASRQTIDCP